MYDLIIRGNLVLSDRVVDNGILLVKQGKVAGILANTNLLPEAKEVIDATGKWVLPGGIDPHVHVGSTPDREGYIRATRGAAIGGITTISDMPYDRPVTLRNTEMLKQKISKIEVDAVVDVCLTATLAKHGGLKDIAPLAEGGVCAFKLSTFENDPNRFPRITDDELYKLFPEIQKTGLVVGFHAENEEIVKANVTEMYGQGTSALMHCKSSPPIAETLDVLKLLEFAHEFKAKLHIYHLATPRAIRLMERFREDGVDVSAETCMHYLLLTEDDMERLKGFGRISPPFRTPDLQEELWEMVLAGRFNFITSDHAVWLHDEKLVPNIFDAKPGAPGVETLVPLLFSEGVLKRGLNIMDFAKLMSTNAAKRFNLYPRKGVIANGSDADFVIIDPSQNWIIDGSKNQSAAKWSPFDGWEVKGKIERTIVRGVTVYDGKDVVVKPGIGQFIPAIG